MIRQAFEYGPLVAWAGLLLTFVRPLRLGRAGSCALGLLLLLLSQKFLIYKIFGGDSFVPELPERFVNLTGWTYSSCMILFGFSCVWWFVRLFLRKKQRLDRRVLLTCMVCATLLAGWGIWEGVRVPRVKNVPLAVKGLPTAFDGYRIVQLSDLHCSPAARKHRTEGIVSAVNALKPDLVCLTGDCVDGSPAQREDDLSPLKNLRAKDGVLGCSGNHEYYHDYAVWGRIYAAWGLQMLDNAHRVITRGRSHLVVGGVTDRVAAWNDRRRMEGPNLDKAFAGAPADGCRILLQHEPLNLPQAARARVRLQLSGHTHGGAILGLDRIVKKMNQGHVRGIYHHGDLTLYVCPGTGQWAGFPLRLGVPAEITVLTLHPAP